MSGSPPLARYTLMAICTTMVACMLSAADDPIAALKKKDLRLPVDGASIAAMKGQFGDERDGGARGHEAVDILAPRNTTLSLPLSGSWRNIGVQLRFFNDSSQRGKSSALGRNN